MSHQYIFAHLILCTFIAIRVIIYQIEVLFMMISIFDVAASIAVYENKIQGKSKRKSINTKLKAFL